MSPPDKRPPPKPPSGATVDVLVGAAKGAAGSQDYVRPELARKGTLPGGMAAIPQPPALPLEHAPTKPAPPQLPLRKTWRLPTPPSALAQARRTPVPPSDDPPADVDATSGQLEASVPPMSHTPDAASLEALRRRAEAAESDRDELLRRERVRTEARGPGPYQKPMDRSQSPVPSSAPSKTDAAIGKAVRTTATSLAERYGLMPLLLVFGMGGGAATVLRPAADPAKAEATLAVVQAMQADVALLREQMAGMLKREAARDQYVRCLEESLDEVGEQLLPAQDRLSNASPLRAYVKRCQRLRPP